MSRQTATLAASALRPSVRVLRDPFFLTIPTSHIRRQGMCATLYSRCTESAHQELRPSRGEAVVGLDRAFSQQRTSLEVQIRERPGC